MSRVSQPTAHLSVRLPYQVVEDIRSTAEKNYRSITLEVVRRLALLDEYQRRYGDISK